MIHKLKTWTQFYQDVVDQKKRFEIRVDDRGFRIGDYLDLIEVDEHRGLAPTGKACRVEVTYVYRGSPEDGFGFKENCVVMSIDLLVSDLSAIAE